MSRQHPRRNYDPPTLPNGSSGGFALPSAWENVNPGETQAHRELKRLAFEWARTNALPLAGCEVRVPKSPYRADVAAVSRHPLNPDGVVALFECKQARADFLRDQADESGVRRVAEAHNERIMNLRRLVAVHRPDLRRGESLFAEFDSYDLRDLRHDTLHGLEREWEILQRKIISCVKFARLRRYQAADYLYLVTEATIMAEHEVPNGWGWLVRNGETLELRLPPLRHTTTPALRLAWLEAITVAGTRASAKIAKAAATVSLPTSSDN
jgi:hypothetical protein